MNLSTLQFPPGFSSPISQDPAVFRYPTVLATWGVTLVYSPSLLAPLMATILDHRDCDQAKDT